MRIRVIVGREGRLHINKSDYIYEEIGARLQRGRSKMYLLVPEQFTLGAERELMAYNRLPGLLGADVLSFKRLEYRILSEVGGIAKTFVDEHGKQMLLQKSIREVQKDLSVYRRSAGKLGFLENICAFISELKQSEITPEALEAAETEVGEGRILSQKLKDIRKIYGVYANLLSDERIDGDDRAKLLCAQIPKSDYLDRSLIWIDGFHTFSNQDFRIIEALAAKADCVTITLTLDPDKNAPDASAFYVPGETLKRIEKIANDLGFEAEIVNLEAAVQPAVSGLDYLERNLFALRPRPYEEEPGDMAVVQCKNIWNEVEKGAQKIVELVRERGFRYKDIVVLAGDMETYGGSIKRAFSEYGIPFFMDDVKKVTENNFLEAVLAALETNRSHYAYEDIFTFVKTGFAPITPEEAQELENYVIEYGIRGNAWEKPFDRPSANEAVSLEVLNASRERLMAPFMTLRKNLRKSRTYADKTRSLVRFLEDINASATIDRLSEALRERGDFDSMGLYNQIWNILMEVFDQINSTMGEESTTLEEYISVLSGGFQSYTVGVIPSRQDVVNITDLMRSRHSEMKALLVFGMNEGVVPANSPSFNLLSERERSQLRKQEMELQDNSDFRRAQEDFLLYTLFAAPSEYLYLSYAMADAEGSTIPVSPLIPRIQAVFPKLTVTSALENTLSREWEAVATPRGTTSSLIHHLRELRYGKGTVLPEETKRLWQAVGKWYDEDDRYHTAFRQIQEALDYDGVDDRLSQGQAIRLFEPPIQASVSRLELYRKCPFSHYVEYGLKPVPRQEYEVEPPDIGTVLHHLIDAVYKEAEREQVSVKDLSQEKTDAMVDAILDETLPQVRHQVFNSTGQYQYLGRKLRRVSKRTVRVLVDHMRRGEFEFKYSEQQFSQILELPSFEETVKVRGVIDRIDVYQREGDTFVKVIDYKSGNKTLNLAEIYYGLSLQLAVYMEAGLEILEGDNLIPGGTFYFHVDDPMLQVNKLDPETLTAALNDSFKLNGIYLDDPRFTKAMDAEADKDSEVISLKSRNSKLSRDEFEDLLSYVKRVIIGMTEKILGGDIAVRPYKKGKETGCEYCPYKGICQFDESIGRASYDVLRTSIPRDEFIQRIKEGGKDNEMD